MRHCLSRESGPFGRDGQGNSSLSSDIKGIDFHDGKIIKSELMMYAECMAIYFPEGDVYTK